MLRTLARFRTPTVDPRAVPRREGDADRDGWDDATGPRPPGLAVARLVAELLTAHDVAIGNRWVTDYSHELDASHGGKRFDVALRKDADEEDAWLVTVRPRGGLLPWTRKRAEGSPSHIAVCTALHDALSGDPRVVDLSWHAQDAWDAGQRDAGATRPT